MSIELVSLGTLRITVSEQFHSDGVPGGSRLVGEASDCRWEGGPVQASQRGRSTSDWVLIDDRGGIAVDARLLLETDDGALICVRYTGRGARLPAAPKPIITAPTFETGDPRYIWLNTVQAVAKGTRDGDTLSYELYEVT